MAASDRLDAVVRDPKSTRTGLIVLLVGAVLSGCSNRQLYESIQYDQKLKCQTLPQSQYEECMEKASQSYEDYKRARDEVIDDERSSH